MQIIIEVNFIKGFLFNPTWIYGPLLHLHLINLWLHHWETTENGVLILILDFYE